MRSKAFQTWNSDDSVEDLEGRIHDGVPRSDLRVRAARHLERLAHHFPWAMPSPGKRLLEVGGGLAYLMEAALERFDPTSIIGLDVAENMIEHARERLRRDQVDDPRLSFLHYDGIDVPLPSDSLDLVFSVASIHHVPKEYAYTLFAEIYRLLAPSGFATLQLLAFSHLPGHQRALGRSYLEELDDQIQQRVGHWHFFYSAEEIYYVLRHVVGARLIHVIDDDGLLYVSFGKDQPRDLYDPALTARLFRGRDEG